MEIEIEYGESIMSKLFSAVRRVAANRSISVEEQPNGCFLIKGTWVKAGVNHFETILFSREATLKLTKILKKWEKSL